jgi:hypothetical protein
MHFGICQRRHYPARNKKDNASEWKVKPYQGITQSKISLDDSVKEPPKAASGAISK